MPLDVSEDGEAADMEVGLLLGLTGGTAPERLRSRLVRYAPGAVALLGPRDDAWRRRRPSSTCGRRASAGGCTSTSTCWIPRCSPPRGVPGDAGTPGGLGWPQLEELLAASPAVGGCAGASVTLYDPELDPSGDDARAVVRLAGTLARR